MVPYKPGTRGGQGKHSCQINLKYVEKILLKKGMGTVAHLSQCDHNLRESCTSRATSIEMNGIFHSFLHVLWTPCALHILMSICIHNFLWSNDPQQDKNKNKVRDTSDLIQLLICGK